MMSTRSSPLIPANPPMLAAQASAGSESAEARSAKVEAGIPHLGGMVRTSWVPAFAGTNG